MNSFCIHSTNSANFLLSDLQSIQMDINVIYQKQSDMGLQMLRPPVGLKVSSKQED